MLMNDRKKVSILSVIHIIVGIWILLLGSPALIVIYNSPYSYAIYIPLLFHITIALFLFVGAYYLHKSNTKVIFRISKINIFISLIYLLVILLQSFSSIYFYEDFGLFFIIYITPVLLTGVLTIWYVKNNMKEIQAILLLVAGVVIFVITVPIFINTHSDIKDAELTIDITNRLFEGRTETMIKNLQELKIINVMSAISIIIGIIFSFIGSIRFIKSLCC